MKLLNKCINIKHDYVEVSETNIEYQSKLNDARNEIETLKLELENKDKALNECMNENVALKLLKLKIEAL